MHLQRASLHCLITVAVVGTHHRQLVQYLPDYQAARFDLLLSDELLVCRAGPLHPQVALQAVEAESVPAEGIYGIHQRLETDATEQLVLCVIRIVVEVIFAWLVTLATAVAHDDVPHPLDPEAVGFLQAAGPSGSLPQSLHVAFSHAFCGELAKQH